MDAVNLLNPGQPNHIPLGNDAENNPHAVVNVDAIINPHVNINMEGNQEAPAVQQDDAGLVEEMPFHDAELDGEENFPEEEGQYLPWALPQNQDDYWEDYEVNEVIGGQNPAYHFAPPPVAALPQDPVVVPPVVVPPLVDPPPQIEEMPVVEQVGELHENPVVEPVGVPIIIEDHIGALLVADQDLVPQNNRDAINNIDLALNAMLQLRRRVRERAGDAPYGFADINAQIMMAQIRQILVPGANPNIPPPVPAAEPEVVIPAANPPPPAIVPALPAVEVPQTPAQIAAAAAAALLAQQADNDLHPHRINVALNFGQTLSVNQMAEIQNHANSFVRNRIGIRERNILTVKGLHVQLIAMLRSQFKLAEPICEKVANIAMKETTNLTPLEKNMMTEFRHNYWNWKRANLFAAGTITPGLLSEFGWFIGFTFAIVIAACLGSFHFMDGLLGLLGFFFVTVSFFVERWFFADSTKQLSVHDWILEMKHHYDQDFSILYLIYNLMAWTALFLCCYCLQQLVIRMWARYGMRIGGTVQVPRG